MSTRASAAVSSRRAKQELVRLLFGAKYSRRGPEAHRKLDPARYSFTDLRKAYLERLQTIHPDKLRHAAISPADAVDVNPATAAKKSNNNDEKRQQSPSAPLPLHGQFVELQEAWDRYEEVAKMIARVGRPEDANFTLFGVGCSFSDSPQERAMRDEIMDQASRGWFSAGGIAETSSNTEDVLNSNKDVPLCDDDLFVTIQDEDHQTSSSCDTSLGDSHRKMKTGPKPSLIPTGYRPKR